MTDRLKGVVVTFETDLRDDDAKAIIDAIKMLRGVDTVSVKVADVSDHMNRMRIRQELTRGTIKEIKEQVDALWKVLHPEEREL